MLRSMLAIAAVAAGTLAFANTGAHACNVKGQYCGQPQWAANAFSGPYAQQPKGAIKLENYYYGRHKYSYKKAYKPHYVVKKVYVKKYYKAY